MNVGWLWQAGWLGAGWAEPAGANGGSTAVPPADVAPSLGKLADQPSRIAEWAGTWCCLRQLPYLRTVSSRPWHLEMPALLETAQLRPTSHHQFVVANFRWLLHLKLACPSVDGSHPEIEMPSLNGACHLEKTVPSQVGLPF
jgi:hypothetical protein